MKDKDKLFRVYPRSEKDTQQAQILEEIINAPRFRVRLIDEFNKQAERIAKEVMSFGYLDGR